MTRFLVTLVALLALAPVSGCTSSPSAAESGKSATAAATAGSAASAGGGQGAPQSGSTLDAAAFKAAISRPGVTIVDVRTPAEFASGHLPGAVNIDVNGAGFDKAISALPAQGEYAVYCRSGNRSATALARMKDLGRGTAYHLGGGIGAWTSAGGPVTTS